jgi:hypothetical protein
VAFDVAARPPLGAAQPTSAATKISAAQAFHRASVRMMGAG